MKRWFSMLLLIGALAGLFGQEAAFALAPPVPASQQIIGASAMSKDCAEMMGLAKQQPDRPCQGLTFDCIAKMGCALPLAFVPPAADGSPSAYRVSLPVPLPASVLSGRTLVPEPHPPARLG